MKLFVIILFMGAMSLTNAGVLTLEQEQGSPVQKTLCLDGSWELSEGHWDKLPSHYSARVPVPGLVKLANPAFSDVGKPSEKRDCFYYRTVFTLEEEDPSNAILQINKAKYGVKIYLNGQKVSEAWHCFAPIRAELTPHLNPPGQANELVLAVGAHIDSLQAVVSTGGEVEKIRYIPGIYDSVQVHLVEQLYFDTVQVAPVFDEGQIVLEAFVRNFGTEASYPARFVLLEKHSGREIMDQALGKVTIRAGQVVKILQSISATALTEWTPEHPQLYRAILQVGPYRHEEPFGWRGLRLDPDYTNRALLNGKPYYFRGTNIALFRFFEDPACRDQPWDETWVRGLFRKFKSLGMNSARTCISVFPKFWYDIADEEGFALFSEYPMWYALKPGVSRADFVKEQQDPMRKYGIYPEGLSAQQLTEEYTLWMRHLMNHPSIIAWDAQNETWSKETGKAIENVRGLDYSNRPWDNGWSPPLRPTDFREAHQYFGRYKAGSEAKNAQGEEALRPFRLSDLPDKDPVPGTLYAPFQWAYKLPLNEYRDQPCVLNEYGYFWLNRDASPTTLTQPYYDAVLGPHASPEERRDHYAYMLQGVTEYWRSVRTCFGVLHVFGLAHSLPPHGATCDNFIDVNALELDPFFEKSITAAFSPVGLCVEQWGDRFAPGEMIDVPVMVTNDRADRVCRNVLIQLVHEGNVLLELTGTVEVEPWGQNRMLQQVRLPDKTGSYTLLARFEDVGEQHVFSRRFIQVGE